MLTISLICPLELGISPGEIKLVGKTGENICKNITIQSDYRGEIIGETKWIRNVKEKREIKDYNLDAKSLDLNIEYSDVILINDKYASGKICIRSENPGNYNGAILYKTKEGYAGVGSWITANITESYKTDLTKITGKSILITREKNNTFAMITIVIFAMLVLMLGTLSFINKKLKSKEQSKN